MRLNRCQTQFFFSKHTHARNVRSFSFSCKSIIDVALIKNKLKIKKVHNVVPYLCVALGFDAGEERWLGESLRTVSQRLSDGSLLL